MGCTLRFPSRETPLLSRHLSSFQRWSADIPPPPYYLSCSAGSPITLVAFYGVHFEIPISRFSLAPPAICPALSGGPLISPASLLAVLLSRVPSRETLSLSRHHLRHHVHSHKSVALCIMWYFSYFRFGSCYYLGSF